MKGLIGAMLLLPTMCMATEGSFYISAGQINYNHSTSSSEVDATTPSFVVGYETLDKYPSVFTLSHVPTYDRTHSIWRGKYYMRSARSHNVFTAGKQINYTFENGIRVFGELGLALVDRKNLALDSHFNFYETIGIRYRNVSLYVTHRSNAGIEGHNLGEDGVFLSWYF